MLHLIPQVKKLEERQGILPVKAVCLPENVEPRLQKALEKLPVADKGVPVTITVTGTAGESYTMDIAADGISIVAPGAAGAFYGIQTLRQIFAQGQVPCLHIEDAPTLEYRGFYHDVTRGKVPTMETLKDLVDKMAYLKLNSLQLYVEHTFPFKEYGHIPREMGCLTPEEMQELDAYCRENFIDFIPSLSTFGHLYELLEQPQYRHLRICQDPPMNRWRARMVHHTIDPRQEESIGIIKSLVDQYAPCFESPWFNICCDETFDLEKLAEVGEDPGKLYVDFVKKIIDHVTGKGKKVMMWADIALKHPEQIPELPEDTVFLNWNYWEEPPEEKVSALAGRKQILCPGTTTWNRFCEHVVKESGNICGLARYAKKYGAIGILNTNWGDWGNPCSLDLAMRGLSLGAAVSWDDTTAPDETFDAAVDKLIFGHEGAAAWQARLSALGQDSRWLDLCRLYYRQRFDFADQPPRELERDPAEVAEDFATLARELEAQVWEQDEYRQEMAIAARGYELIARLLAGERVDTEPFNKAFSAKWLQKNKPSELFRIQEMLTWLNQ